MSDETGSGTTGETALADAPPASAPPQDPPSLGGASDGHVPRKKRKGCLIALTIAVVLIILAIIGVAVVVGTLSKPEDDAVAFSEADFDSAVAKAGVVWPTLPEGADPNDYERLYSGSQPLDATFTEAELSALMSYRHGSSYRPIKRMQIDLTGGDSVRASAVVSYVGRDWRVSADGSAGISGSTLAVDVASATVAGIDVPAEYLPLGEDFLEGVVNPRLARIPGFDIESLEMTDEGVHVIGTIWETAEYVEVR